MFKDRLGLYKSIEERNKSKIIVYITGDRPQLDTKIHSEILDYFVYHLDEIGDVNKISLYLYTRGGDALASWSIANLIRQFCKELEIIVPAKCFSGGTLICLGANRIIMTKQARLGPIDPSVNYPLNPQIPGAPPNAKVPVSVEAVNGYIDYAKSTLGDKADLKEVFLSLSEKIHPLVLGEAFRARSQIRMLAQKLLAQQISDEEIMKKNLDFLCSESGSHDYTINRKEAKEYLGLCVEKPDDSLYGLIKGIYDDISNELELTQPFNPGSIVSGSAEKQYSFRRALLESIKGGTHVFVSEGVMKKERVQAPMSGIPGMPGVINELINDNRSFEGWRHENV